jgi:5-formyltetrahydrofolate cyclo-ligase
VVKTKKQLRDELKAARLAVQDKGSTDQANKAGAAFYARMNEAWNAGADFDADGENDTPPVSHLWNVWTFAAAAAGVLAGLWWYFTQRGQ